MTSLSNQNYYHLKVQTIIKRNTFTAIYISTLEYIFFLYESLFYVGFYLFTPMRNIIHPSLYRKSYIGLYSFTSFLFTSFFNIILGSIFFSYLLFLFFQIFLLHSLLILFLDLFYIYITLHLYFFLLLKEEIYIFLLRIFKIIINYIFNWLYYPKYRISNW